MMPIIVYANVVPVPSLDSIHGLQIQHDKKADLTA